MSGKDVFSARRRFIYGVCTGLFIGVLVPDLFCLGRYFVSPPTASSSTTESSGRQEIVCVVSSVEYLPACPRGSEGVSYRPIRVTATDGRIYVLDTEDPGKFGFQLGRQHRIITITAGRLRHTVLSAVEILKSKQPLPSPPTNLSV